MPNNEYSRPTPVAGQIYKHFKGFISVVHDIAKHSETGELLVVYNCFKQYENSSYLSNIYARPLDMFMSEVDYQKYPEVTQKYRLELILEDDLYDVPAVILSDALKSMRTITGNNSNDMKSYYEALTNAANSQLGI